MKKQNNVNNKHTKQEQYDLTWFGLRPTSMGETGEGFHYKRSEITRAVRMPSLIKILFQDPREAPKYPTRYPTLQVPFLKPSSPLTKTTNGSVIFHDTDLVESRVN